MKINIKEELRMLDGNIARICMTDSLEELERMKAWAEKRIGLIYEKRKEDLTAAASGGGK